MQVFKSNLVRNVEPVVPESDESPGVDEVENQKDLSVFTIEQMAGFLESGTHSQRTVILFEVQQLLEHCIDETLKQIVPVICKHVAKWPEEVQISAAEALLDVVQQEIPKPISKMICSAAFDVVNEHRTEDTFEAWGEILVLVLPDVEWSGESEIDKVITTIDEFSKTNEEACRKLAARVLGSLSECLSPEKVKVHILDRAIQMADDPDVEVRGMVAESLAFIGAELDIEVTEKTVWPKLDSLLNDPDARIHAACLRTVAHVIDANKEKNPKSALFKHHLPPVFVKECTFAKKAASEDQRNVDDDTYLLLEIISEVYGPFVHVIHPYFADENHRKEAFKAFLAMSTCNGPIVRRYCAFNVPGVVSSLFGKFAVELSGIVEFLSRDPDQETRWNLAAGIHVTCRALFNKNTQENLFKAILALLQDGNPLVRMRTLEHFHELILSLSNDGDPASMKKLIPIFENITLLSEGNWRTQELLAQQLEKVSDIVPLECLRGTVLPLLYTMAEESTYLVRKATMPAIAKALRCIPLPQEREELMKTFVSEWGKGGVFWMRLSFLECANAALKVFSADLFNYLVAPTIYELARDNVPNVRLRVARMLHEMAPACMHDERYKSTVEWLKKDMDWDVKATLDRYDERIVTVMANIGQFRKENEAKEDAEAELEEMAERSKPDARKKTNKTKMKASTILPKISKAGNLGSSAGKDIFNEESPVSVTSTFGGSDTLTARLSGLLATGKGKSKEASKQGAVEDVASPRSGSRNSLKRLLSNVGGGRRSRQQSQ